MRLACAVGVIGLLSSSTAAHAVSITNRDEHDHKVTVIEGDTKTDHVLKPSQALNGICAKGCTIRLNDDEDDEYQLEANDVVSIEEGSLYYDKSGYAGSAGAGTGDGKPAGKRLDGRSCSCAPPPATSGGAVLFLSGRPSGRASGRPPSIRQRSRCGLAGGPKRRSNAARSAPIHAASMPARPSPSCGEAGDPVIADAARHDAGEVRRGRAPR